MPFSILLAYRLILAASGIFTLGTWQFHIWLLYKPLGMCQPAMVTCLLFLICLLAPELLHTSILLGSSHNIFQEKQSTFSTHSSQFLCNLHLPLTNLSSLCGPRGVTTSLVGFLLLMWLKKLFLLVLVGFFKGYNPYTLFQPAEIINFHLFCRNWCPWERPLYFLTETFFRFMVSLTLLINHVGILLDLETAVLICGIQFI